MRRLVFNALNALIFLCVFVGNGCSAAPPGDAVWPIRRLTGHSYFVLALAFSADGTKLASASEDKSLRIWDVASGKSIFRARVENVRAIAHLRASKQFITGASRYSAPHLWGERGSDDGKAFEVAENYNLMALSADQQMIAFAGGGCEFVILATGGTGRVVSHLSDRAQPESPPENLRSIAFSHDGKLLIGGGDADHKLRLWEVTTGKLARTFNGAPNDWPLAIAVSPDGRRLIAGGKDGTTLWDMPTGRHVATIPRFARQNSCVSFLADGTRVICGEGFNPELWNVVEPTKPKRVATFWDPECYASALAVSPDGRYLAAAGGWGSYGMGTFPASGFDISLWEIPK